MATVSFDKAAIDARTSETPVVEAPLAVAPSVGTTVALPKEQSPFRGENEFDSKDLNLPYVSLTQKISPLIDEIPNLRAGSFVFAKELILTPDPKTPATVIIVKLSKSYEEATEFGGDERPRIFKTIAEARAEGFDEDYQAEPRVLRRADFLFLVQAPEGLTEAQLDMFPYDIDGKSYALGNFTVRKAAYNTTAKVVITLRELGTFLDRNGAKDWRNGTFELSSVLKTNEKNSWYQPVLKASKKTPDAVLEFLELMFPTA